MKPVYINSATCISAQPTLEEDFLSKLEPYTGKVQFEVIPPSYKEYIPANLIRRMSKSVKMSTVCAELALKKAKIDIPDAIIVGTGMGCGQDSEKFLRAVIENEEEFLTPTHFIQSTHNTVAGQIALVKACHGYNFTYVNSGSSLEMALLDAQLQLNDDDTLNILVGATDEMAVRTTELYKLIGKIKSQEALPVDYLHSSTDGVVWGEGSAFFCLQNLKKQNTLAQLRGVHFCNQISSEEELSYFIKAFLEKHRLSSEDIDVLILGISGDKTTDEVYHKVRGWFPKSVSLYFKHLCGEYNTSSGFALYMASQILAQQAIPTVMKMENRDSSDIRNVLIYNHFFGEDHSLMLLSRADLH